MISNEALNGIQYKDGDTIITTTLDNLHTAIEQSVRPWIHDRVEFAHEHTSETLGQCDVLEQITQDLTAHLFGNVAMSLKWGKWAGELS